MRGDDGPRRPFVPCAAVREAVVTDHACIASRRSRTGVTQAPQDPEVDMAALHAATNAAGRLKRPVDAARGASRWESANNWAGRAEFHRVTVGLFEREPPRKAPLAAGRKDRAPARAVRA